MYEWILAISVGASLGAGSTVEHIMPDKATCFEALAAIRVELISEASARKPAQIAFVAYCWTRAVDND